jgi:hypothetical protein
MTVGSALLAAAVIGSACATSGEGTLDEPEMTLTADNQNFADATLYAVWDVGPRERLGMVTGLTSETFPLGVQGSSLRLQVDFIAGGSFTSDEILVGPGDDLIVRIPPLITE